MVVGKFQSSAGYCHVRTSFRTLGLIVNLHDQLLAAYTRVQLPRAVRCKRELESGAVYMGGPRANEQQRY